MIFKNRLSIKNEIFVLGLFSSLSILLVFGFLLSTSIFNISIDNAKRSIKETNMQISLFTEGFFTEVTNFLEILAENSDIKNAADGDEEIGDRALSLYRDVLRVNKNILYVYSGYDDGALLINDYLPPEDFDSSVRPWYIAAIDNSPNIATGVPYREANSGEWVIAPSKALLNEQGNIIGVIAADITLEMVVKQLSERHLYHSQRSYVMDQEGNLIIDSDESLIGQKLLDIRNLIKDSQGEITYTVDGKKKWAYYNTFNSTDWILITEVDRWEVLQPLIRQIMLYIFSVLMLAIFLGTLLSKVFGKRFAEPLTELGKRISVITAGEKIGESSYKYSNHEIARIADNIEKMAEHSLNKKANQLKIIIESTEDGILVVNQTRYVIYVNTRFKELWQITRDVSASENARLILDEVLDQVVDRDTLRAKVQSLYETEETESDIIHFNDGRVYEYFSCPLIDDGVADGRLWSFRDITERKQAEEKLHFFATTDELTGLWNRRYFMHSARQELERAKRYNQTFSVMILDIDHFKKINDNLGHAAGDIVLEHLAIIINKCFRKVDIPGRIGGEEFGILLPNTELDNAVLLAEKLRQRIEDTPAQYEGKEIICTGSIGVTVFHDEISSLDEMLKIADEALYEAKHSGRNCVVKKI